MTKTPNKHQLKSISHGLIATVTVLTWLGAPAPVFGQPAGCTLTPDDKNPSEQILRCGDSLTIRNAPDTRYELTGQNRQQPLGAVRLESGALLIEFTASERQKRFQILTPHAIAAVRGTQWAVEVNPDRTSTLVISGVVEVMRPKQRKGALLHDGEGSDVSAGRDPITVKRWGQARIDALMARFGQ